MTMVAVVVIITVTEEVTQGPIPYLQFKIQIASLSNGHLQSLGVPLSV